MTADEVDAENPVEVRVPDEGWASAVRGLFGPDAVEVTVDGEDGPASGERRRVEVRRDGDGYRVRAGPEMADEREPGRLAGPGEAIAVLELLLTRTLLHDRSRMVQLHAAGARIGATGVVALGAAGAGKSSLALSWSLSEWPLLGDDVVLVDADGAARPFRRLVKVDVERLEEQGIRPEETHAWVPGWREAWYDPREGGGWSRGPCPVGLVALLDRREESGGPRASELSAPGALGALLESSLPSGLGGAAAVDPLRRLLDGCRSLRLSYASSRAAARFLAREARRERTDENPGEGGEG